MRTTVELTDEQHRALAAVATRNRRHLERVDGLRLMDLDEPDRG